MEWVFALDGDGRVMRIDTSGHFGLPDQERMFEELGAHPSFSSSLAFLFDNRRLDLSGSNFDVIRESVEVVQRFVRTRRVERLAGLVNPGADFGVGRQFELLTDAAGGHGFRIFVDEHLALRWLRGERD